MATPPQSQSPDSTHQPAGRAPSGPRGKGLPGKAWAKDTKPTIGDDPAFFESAFERTAIGMALVAPDGRWLRVNQATCELLGYTADELLALDFQALTHPDDLEQDLEAVRRVLAGDLDKYQLEKRYFQKSGHIIWALINVSLVREDNGKPLAFVAQIQDISARKAAELQLHRENNYDALTGLHNRTSLLRELDRITKAYNARPNEDHAYAVMMLDLDHFKNVNDSMGHDVGDALLQAVAQRLQHSLADTPSKQTVIARLGGDEFAVVLDDVNEQVAKEAAQQIVTALEAPHQLCGQAVRAAGSVGLAMAIPGNTRENALRDADVAMYRSKHGGRGRLSLFDPSMNAEAERRLKMEGQLRKALERNRLDVEYQPIVNLHTGEAVAVEALARWKDPELGSIPPADFIPVAEETGLIVPLGHWVLSEALEWAGAWRAAGCSALRVSVNISPLQLAQPDLLDQLDEMLRMSELPPDALSLEMREECLVDNAMRDTLVAIADRGVRLQIDDFGSGFVSLELLHQLPISGVKLDRRFLEQTKTSRDVAAIIHAMVGLANNLGVRVTAEGIETAEQLALLQACDCEQGQGFFFSKALDPASALAYIEKSTQAAAPRLSA
ncbi:MAG: EAL domain-containing protein [Planctomycetota bacterium]